MNNEEIISRELQKLDGPSRIGKKWIKCFLGTHSDSTPSFGINAVESGKYPVGTWYCFGCGKAGSWNQIAKHFGLRQVDPNKKDTHAKRRFHHSTPEVFTDLGDLVKKTWDKLSFCRQFPDPVWREIPTKLLKDHGCECWFDPRAKDYVIIQPVWVGGELVGAVKSSWEKSEMSHITSPGSWVKESGLLGYDELPRGKNFVVVEGPRDKWRLTRDGIPAVAILGALQWTKAKANLIAARNPPTPLLFLDGDAAGVNALDLSYDLLKTAGLDVKFVDAMALTEKARAKAQEAGDPNWEKIKIDPANCDEETIAKVKRFCRVEL